MPILVGLTNKQSAAWTDASVGGLLLLGVVILGLFLLWERRASEPVVPIHLFRLRAFTISVIAVFLAAIGFFATVVFLPRWFQSVGGSSATESGYQILPLLAGLIVSAIVSGQIVSRTGKYRLLAAGALVLMSVGLFTLSLMNADTPVPVLWLCMFITGLGVGPTFAVFTLIVQSSVPVYELGSGTSSVTFFQQVGGTVGLAITGTIFAETLTSQVPAQLGTAAVPPEALGAAAPYLTPNLLSAPGDLSAMLLASMPPDVQAIVSPVVNEIVQAIHRAFSVATAATFVPGIVTGLIAAGLVLFLRDPEPGTVKVEGAAPVMMG
ncbi:MAG: MFS transporter [Chloroflexota bacterium]